VKQVPIFLFALFLATFVFASPVDKPAASTPNLAGSWQFSWEARIATERGILRLQQDGTQLKGGYTGPGGSPVASGTVNGNNVSINLAFSGVHPFTIVFTGTVDGDKMSGKFQIANMKDGYDAHGENARPTDYSWKASRISGPPVQSASQATSSAAH